jgi:hypothetical protein
MRLHGAEQGSGNFSKIWELRFRLIPAQIRQGEYGSTIGLHTQRCENRAQQNIALPHREGEALYRRPIPTKNQIRRTILVHGAP